MKRIFLYLLAFLPIHLLAADYVEVINTASVKHETGRRVIYEMNVGSFTSEGTFSAAGRQLGELKVKDVAKSLTLKFTPVEALRSRIASTGTSVVTDGVYGEED